MVEAMSEGKKLAELNKFYDESVSLDKDIFAEQRSNVLLISGDHYQKKNWKWLSHFREQANLSDDQKIRLVKNHVSRIYKSYVNKVMGMAPGVAISPHNEKELQDQKSAELHKSVHDHYKKQLNMKEKVRQYAEDFCGIGEVFVQVGWDWDKGYVKRVEQVVTGMDDGMQPQVEEKHVWSGSPVLTRHFGFNVFRPVDCQDLDDAPWLGIRKMVDVDFLKSKYAEKEEIVKKLEPDGQTSFLVFDSSDSGYKEKKNQVLVREIYYRPSAEYPKGYFYYFTKEVILEEGELPFGIWPFAWAGFDSIPTHPRARSFIRQIKPYQIEINRSGSKIAEHQITLGDDKLIMSSGGKMSPGGQAPGIRAYSVTGQAPVIVPGRTGEQYLGYMSATISEMYQVAMVSEELEDKIPAQVDPYALLLQSSRWKTRFSMNVQRFENFLVNLNRILLETIRAYIEEDELIQVVGKAERVNISEFKNAEEIGYQIVLEPQVEDIDSKIGKKMSLDRYIQYSGANMTKEDIGKFIRLDPYLNKEQLFNDYTLNYDNSVNDILALDRGQMPVMNRYRYTDPNYIVQKLSNRMGQADFQFLPPQIQQAYQGVLQKYEQLIAQMVQEKSALNQQYIPSGGTVIRTDMWIPDPANPAKQVRAGFPYEALSWLNERLTAQGMDQAAMRKQQLAVVGDISRQIQANQAQQVPQQQVQSGQPQMQGAPQAAQLLRQKLQQQIPGQG